MTTKYYKDLLPIEKASLLSSPIISKLMEEYKLELREVVSASALTYIKVSHSNIDGYYFDSIALEIIESLFANLLALKLKKLKRNNIQLYLLIKKIINLS